MTFVAADPWVFGTTQLITVGVAGLAFVGVALTATLRWRADRRDELWRRMKWAFDQCWHERASARSVGRFALQSFIVSAHDPDHPQPPTAVPSYDLVLIKRVLDTLREMEEL